MKKDFCKKLTLNKSTITNLEHQEMKNIQGGYVTASCPDRCNTNEVLCTKYSCV